MGDVNSLATDERTAHVVLAAASEPGDTTTGRLLTAVGAVETVRLAIRSGSIPGLDRASTEAWRRRLSERLGSGLVQRVIERTHAWMSTFGRLRRCPDRHHSMPDHRSTDTLPLVDSTNYASAQVMPNAGRS